MELRQKTTTKKLRGALMMNGLDYQAFAERHDFSPDTVRTIVKRHWGKKTRPRGRISQAVIHMLESYLKKETL